MGRERGIGSLKTEIETCGEAFDEGISVGVGLEELLEGEWSDR